jgi:hypothetical protein
MTNPFRYFNSSPEVIRLVVMMYVRYPLSLRNVEDLSAERGFDISYETAASGGTVLARCSPPRSARDRRAPLRAIAPQKGDARTEEARGAAQFNWCPPASGMTDAVEASQ